MSAILKPPSFETAGGTFNITMPYDTLGYILGEMFDISGMLDRMQIRMVSTLLATISIGIYTVCAAYAAKILIRRDSNGNRKKLLSVTAAMYVATFIYWVAFVVGQFQTLRAVVRHLSDEYWWLHSLAVSVIPPSECFPASPLGDSLEYCTSVQAPLDFPTDGGAITQSDCIGTATLTFNVVIGDAIVWWRVWVLWNKNRPILACCCIVLLGTLVCGIADSRFSCTSGPVVWNSSIGGAASNFTELGAFFGDNFFGLTAIILSLFSNTLATVLVGCKAWRHRRRAKKHFAQVPGVTRVQRVLRLLVESGIAYCILWAFVLSANLSTVVPDYSVGWTTGLAGWSVDILYFTEGCLVAFVGIYPTLIIILVALDKSEIERQSLAYSIPVAWGLQSSPVRVEVATDVTYAADARADPDMRPHSVILIGSPESPNGSSTQLSEAVSEDVVELTKTEK
ncbi:hypothetical protein V8D89_014327 [Ganoderma adspersum]